MHPSRLWLSALTLAGILGSGAQAQELDAVIKPDQGGAVIVRDDIGAKAKEVCRLGKGESVTVYMGISSDSHYFVKKKASGAGEGSGWVPRSHVELTQTQTETAVAPAVTVPAMTQGPANILEMLREKHAAKEAAPPAPAAPAPVPAQEDETDWDMPKDHWARAAIEELQKAGIIRVPNGKFEGENTVNRYELALMAQRIHKQSKESCETLAKQLAAIEQSGQATSKQVSKLSGRIEDVEGKVAKMAEAIAKKSPATSNDAQLKEMGRDVENLRQTFTRSIAGLALDRSKIEEYKAGWAALLSRVEALEAKMSRLVVPAES